MKTEIEFFKATRENALRLIKDLSLDQINKIPVGFTGNIAWHLGHMVATHKGLVYQLNSAPGGLPKEFVVKYKKDSVPETPIDQKELDFIKEQLISQVAEFETDLKKEGFFGDNIPYMTSYPFEIKSFEEGVKFSNIHQALHLGYVLALRRLVTV